MNKKRASLKGIGQKLKQEAPVAQGAHPLDAPSSNDPKNIINIPVEAINTNPKQPRKYFDPEKLNDLAASIKKQGLLQPIIVKRLDANSFLLVAGERRFRACGLVGVKKIAALITQGDDLEIALIENLQREQLRPIEEAEGLKALADRFNYKQKELANVVGKPRSVVAETLSLLNLPKLIKEECRTSDIASKSLLLQLVRESDQEKKQLLWDAIKSGKLSVRTAKAVRKNTPLVGRPKHVSKSFLLEDLDVVVTVRFKKSTASEDEFLFALRSVAIKYTKLEEKQNQANL